MIRALTKGAMLFAFGKLPGGAHLYRELTRSRLGTQATHVDKLQRVLPSYVQVWRERGGLELEGASIWIHEGGWTPFWFLANYLLSGKGGVITNVEGVLQDRYLARAVNGVLAAPLPEGVSSETRRQAVEGLRWQSHITEILPVLGGVAHHTPNPTTLPIESDSIDLAHSGGALEHYAPAELEGFLRECYRVLRPGGVASHVFDHRDHLYHADKRIPFLAHLALSESRYRFWYGHPLTYHNRLLPEEIASLFEKVGFERIALRRLRLPDFRYCEDETILQGIEGLPRQRLAKRFLHATDADLHTAAVHYLFRKPQGHP